MERRETLKGSGALTRCASTWATEPWSTKSPTPKQSRIISIHYILLSNWPERGQSSANIWSVNWGHGERMTMLYKEQIRCSQCQGLSEQAIIGSTSAWGSPDLDTRPAEVIRSTLPQQVQVCPHCGYCMPSITAPLPDISAILASNEYRLQLKSKEYPELANRFLCSSLILETLGRLNEAGWACVYGAWACDDAGETEAAKTCRLRGEHILGRAISKGQGTADRPGVNFLICADLLRTAGQFRQADQRTQEGFSPKCDQELLLLLIFERWLSCRGDMACHTVEEGLRTVNKLLHENPSEE